jgi:hypothetical protein
MEVVSVEDMLSGNRETRGVVREGGAERRLTHHESRITLALRVGKSKRRSTVCNRYDYDFGLSVATGRIISSIEAPPCCRVSR